MNTICISMRKKFKIPYTNYPKYFHSALNLTPCLPAPQGTRFKYLEGSDLEVPKIW